MRGLGSGGKLLAVVTSAEVLVTPPKARQASPQPGQPKILPFLENVVACETLVDILALVDGRCGIVQQIHATLSLEAKQELPITLAPSL